MAKVPLQNTSAWSHMKTVEEASSTVSKWPAWKRERQLFSQECKRENSSQKKNSKEDFKSA
jgi:hypothetical protein